MVETSAGWKKWAIAAVVITIIAAAVMGPGHTQYRLLKEQQALTTAQAAFAKGDYRSAVLSAQQVLELNPTNTAMCELMAQLADLAKSPTTLDWRKKVAEAVPTVENKLVLAETAMRYQSRPYPLTAQILIELQPAATNVVRFHLVSAEYALALRQLGAAAAHFAAAAELAPTNRLYRLDLALVELSSIQTDKLAAARANLQSFLTDTNLAAPALRGLITDRLTHGEITAARDFSAELLRTPQAQLDDHLQHLRILKNLSAPDFSAQLAALKKNTATNLPGAVKIALWMEANQLAAEAATWLAGLPASLRNQPMAAMARASALEATRDWPALREFCAHGDWQELNFLRLAFLSRAWSQLGDAAVTAGNWHAAVDKAGNRYGALIGLLELTTRWQLATERQDLFWRLLQKFPRERWISKTLEQQCLATGDTPGLWRIYQQLAAAFPGEVGWQNNFAYTSLLLKKDPLAAEALAAKLQKQFPTNASIVSTYAFALNLRGRNAAALAAMQPLPPRELHEPAVALHYAILLVATGKAAAAEPYLAIARSAADLLPEEKALLATVTIQH